ncbi:hypothetical protein [Falsigemmobacter faecalis]|uniref:DUF995 domain-containing protein n=1 Tax=Falsigemmobacter faecalis TaxID=2488730 RepID=A0A3P3DWC0_9RHOB|nr:hypothetical protein [Falsigemmobacter faecalis]RRH78495.1 hypothetical protein EG244_00640 [Falsigemmobacter faecalis]
MHLPAALVFLLAAPAAALDGAGFEAAVTGQTLEWQNHGIPYGAEQYLPDRRVIWQFEGGPCQYGTWSDPEPGQICFLYDNGNDRQCWRFEIGGSGLRAEFLGLGHNRQLQEVSRSTAPLSCPGPGLGV